MRYYENLSPTERRRVVLRAVAFSSAMEGMTASRDECLEELRGIERGQAEQLLTPPREREDR
jgi:hypothetical protein